MWFQSFEWQMLRNKLIALIKSTVRKIDQSMLIVELLPFYFTQNSKHFLFEEKFSKAIFEYFKQYIGQFSIKMK